MRINPTHNFLAVLILIFAGQCFAQEDLIKAGDYLFVEAQLVECGDKSHIVEVGDVSESEEVTFFEEFSFSTQKRTAETLTVELAEAWNKRTGQNSKSIRVRRVSDPRTATYLMLVLLEQREKGFGCNESWLPKEPDTSEHDRFAKFANSAAHNKSFKPQAAPAWTAQRAAA